MIFSLPVMVRAVVRAIRLASVPELQKRNLKVESQVELPIIYDGIKFDEGLRLDLLINKEIICEIKASEKPHPVWDAQIISQLRLANKPLGFLINFNVPRIKEGIKRFRI